MPEGGLLATCGLGYAIALDMVGDMPWVVLSYNIAYAAVAIDARRICLKSQSMWAKRADSPQLKDVKERDMSPLTVSQIPAYQHVQFKEQGLDRGHDDVFEFSRSR